MKRTLRSLIYLAALSFTLQSFAEIEVKKVQVGQIEMAYYTRGSGPPLVMINGFRSTMSMWDPALLELLEKKYELILFDNRGVGFSTDTAENQTTIPQMADDTFGLIRALGLNHVCVLGWSMGGRIAQQLAVRHPEIVEKLILCATNAGGSHSVSPSDDVLKKLNSPESTTEEKLSLLFPDSPEGKAAGLSYYARLSRAIESGSVPRDVQVSKQTIERQTIARGASWNQSEANYKALADIKIPTLVADGIEDVINPPKNARIIADKIPFAWSAFFDGGHAFLFQDAKRFSDLVTVFLFSQS